MGGREQVAEREGRQEPLSRFAQLRLWEAKDLCPTRKGPFAASALCPASSRRGKLPQIDKHRHREKGNRALRKRKIQRWYLTVVSWRWPTGRLSRTRSARPLCRLHTARLGGRTPLSPPGQGRRSSPTPRPAGLRAVPAGTLTGQPAEVAAEDLGAPGNTRPGSLLRGAAQGAAQSRGAPQGSRGLASVCPLSSPARPCAAGSDCLLCSC